MVRQEQQAGRPVKDDELKKAAMGGAVKGAIASFMECILEPLKSCYNSCCDCCDAD
ncbi:hypothetical protein ACP70R_033587 [Stipagrostis hirtigluma subsp. patula]